MKRLIFFAVLIFVAPAWAEDYQEQKDAAGTVVGYVCIDPAGCGDASTGASIPAHATGNRHSESVAAWIGAGNAPRPAPPAEMVAPSWDGTAWVEGQSVEEAKRLALVRLAEDAARIVAHTAAGSPRYSDLAIAYYREARGDALDTLAASPTNPHAAQIVTRVNALKAWLIDVSIHHEFKRSAIASATSVPAVRAVEWDFSVLDATDPSLSMGEIALHTGQMEAWVP